MVSGCFNSPSLAVDKRTRSTSHGDEDVYPGHGTLTAGVSVRLTTGFPDEQCLPAIQCELSGDLAAATNANESRLTPCVFII